MTSKSCCDAGSPVTSTYEPRGSRTPLGDTELYITGDGPAAVIVIYDIFGFGYNQVFQVCDRVAQQAGITVACPDVFRGKPWTKDRFPPKPEHDFQGFLARSGSWDVVSKDIDATVKHLRTAHNIIKFGTLGFCWGAGMAIKAAIDPTFSAVGCVHPAFFGKDKAYAENCQAPVIILPAKGDPMETLKEVFDHKPFGKDCVYQRFDDQTHGFCAARGDWSKPEVAAAATKAIGLLSDFFKKHLLL